MDYDKLHPAEPNSTDKSKSCDKNSKSACKCGNCTACKCGNCTKLCIGSLSLAVGIVNGLLLLLIGLVATFYNWGHSMVRVLGSVYHGFEATIIGGIWGGLEGFFVGIVCGAILACVYNGCLRCCCHFKCKSKCQSTKETP